MPRPASFWLAVPSRFAALRPSGARFVIGLLILLLVLCLTALAVPDPEAATTATRRGDQTDLMLYEKVVAGIKGGGDYYGVTADALRAGHYPLRPFFTFRLPGLAMVLAALPDWAPRALLMTLALTVALAWALRLGEALPRLAPRLVAAFLLFGSMLAFLQGDLAAFHEIWAGLLMALSLALRRPGRWVEAVAIGLAAMLIRETAALFVALMGGMAWLEGERREARGWALALLLFAVAVGAHAHAVMGVTEPFDPRSPGWMGLNGFGFFVRAITLATALQLVPLWVAALLVGLSLFGWISWNDPLGLRMTVILAAYAAVIGVFARLDTFYWGLIVAPLFLVGLVFVPDGLRDLATRALDKRRIKVTRVAR